MEVFRITRAKYADKIFASGRSARWNSTGMKMVYSAATRSLACLENIVHHSDTALLQQFKVMVLYVPDEVFVESLDFGVLPENWHLSDESSYEVCRRYGDKWSAKNSSAILRVPSAIVKNEFNYLINPSHPDFNKIQLIAQEPFLFDPRVKEV